MKDNAQRDLIQQFVAGSISRRDFVGRAAALGLSASTAGALVTAAGAVAHGDSAPASPVPDYIPVREGDIVQPITEPLTAEKVTFRVLATQTGEVSSFEENRFTEWLEAQTNVHVEWQLVAEEEAGSQLNLMLASGDVPEIIFGIVSPSQEALYGAQGLFLPLNNLIAQHASRLQKAFEIYPDVRAVLTAPDGNLYSMLGLEDCYHCSMSQKLWIYQPWLDELGLAMPETADEFEQVLMAFQDQDLNGNGAADEIPLSTSATPSGAWQGPLDLFFMNSFLYNPGQPWLVLGTGAVVEPIYNKPEWKEGLKYLHRLYTQGLIDPQSFTQDLDGLQRLGNNPDDVILGSCTAGWVGVFMATDETQQDARWTEYVALPPLQGPQGVRYAAWSPYTGGPAAVITNACKDPALAVRWIDTMYDREVTLRSERGVPGEDWRWAHEGETDFNGEQAVWELVRGLAGEPTDHAWQGIGPKFTAKALWESQAVDPDSIDIEFRLFRMTNEAYEPYQQPKEMTVPPLAFTQEQAIAIADPETTITQYVNQMFTRFVRGESDIDGEWETYLDTLNQMGLANYLQVYQEAYDAKYGQ